jgi:hypothetical protein
MIGFQNELNPERGQITEDLDTRNLEKKELYDMLAHCFYLPPYQSRGVNREYLLRVHKAQCYRAPLMELKHFEVELTSKMTKRVGAQNNGLLVRKLNLLLRSRNMPDLGFDEYDPPEQCWLYRIARFLDQTNLTEFFDSPVIPEPEVSPSSHQISKVHYGRIKASAYFFRLKEARSNKKLWDNLRIISDTYRNYLSQKLSIDVLRKELASSEQKLKDMEINLDDQISKCAFTYTSIENPRIRPEMIINGSESVTKEIRDAIVMRCKM